MASRPLEDILGYTDVLRVVAEYAASPMGRQAILEATPEDDGAVVVHRLRQVEEITSLFHRAVSAPMGGLGDVTEPVESLGLVGAAMEPEWLYRIGAFASAADKIYSFFSEQSGNCPRLWALASGIEPTPETARAILRAIAPNGEVLESASPELRAIRRHLQQAEGRIGSKLQSLVGSLSKDNALADDFYTQRNGRYVLPVKAGSRGKVQGIVHGASNTGQTLFIEPLSVMELSNEVVALQVREAEEIRRILVELCDIARADLPALQQNLIVITEIDSLYGRAKFGYEREAALPKIRPGAPLDLREAHHPLLFLHQRKTSIPIRVQMEDADRVLMISGPNAGGKTTAIKTVGLLCMMAQSAIPVPCAPNSTLPVFSSFFVDIGDDQDVQEGLSTFSSHVRNIKRILEESDPSSLILLDELGTATDPTEGGCLAVAIIERLRHQAALVVVTSHLAVLKNWAHETEGARNCSFHLDKRTLQPSFVLTMDVPGASEALVVAEQQGLDAALIQRAREILPPGQEDVTSLIVSLQRKNDELDRLKREEAERVEQFEMERDRYQRLYEQYERERKDFKKTILEEKKKILDLAKADVERRIAGLPTKDELNRARQELRRDQETVRADLSKMTKPAAPPEEVARLRKGSRVIVEGMSDIGQILMINDNKGRATVQIKGLTMEFPMTRLRPPAPEEKQAAKEAVRAAQASRRGGVRVVKRPDSDMKLELDLHGMFVEDAIELVDQYLSDAALYHAQSVRLCHGLGTGRLRRGVHEFLKKHSLVKNYRYGQANEGGAGVTIVTLRD